MRPIIKSTQISNYLGALVEEGSWSVVLYVRGEVGTPVFGVVLAVVVVRLSVGPFPDESANETFDVSAVVFGISLGPGYLMAHTSGASSWLV